MEAGVTIGRAGGPRWADAAEIEVTRHAVALPGLPAALDGTTIAQISDFHMGCGGTNALIHEIVRRTNAIAADYIFITGDFVDDHRDEIVPAVKAVSCLRAPGGVFACLGNHDHRGDPDLLIRMLQQADIQVLVNRAVPLQPGFWLAGVDDLYEGVPDLDAALHGIPPDAAAILLCHNPWGLAQVPEQRDVLILSGHTHGAQLRLPFPTPKMICLLHLRTKWVHGWYERGSARMYVNRGVGVTGPWPLNRRINCRPEIAIFTLRS